MQRESRDGVHQQRLAERRARPRAALQVDRRFHVHERQRHELGEPTARALLLPRAQEMPRPVLRPFDVAEHDRHVGAQADLVRRGMHLEPLIRRDLVGADHAPHLVVEDLRRGPR